MWSVGCIFAELLHGKPIFPGKDEPEQIHKIFELCGAPDEANWPGVSKIPWYNNFKPNRGMRRRLRDVFRNFDRHALELLERMLTLDPAQRISAKDALDAEYFWIDPLPCDPKSLPKYEASDEFQTKKKRQQQRQQEEAAKRQKLQHPPPHARLPPVQHSGQGHAQMQPNQPMHGSQPAVAAGGPSVSHYGKPRGPSGRPNRYSQGSNPSGGYGHPNPIKEAAVMGRHRICLRDEVRPIPGRLLGVGAGLVGMGLVGPIINKVGPTEVDGRGLNMMGRSRNQQYGWQQ